VTINQYQAEVIFNTLSTEGGRLFLDLLDEAIKDHEQEILDRLSRPDTVNSKTNLKHAVARKTLLEYRELLDGIASRAPKNQP
jgi:hypothetical protein